MEQMNTKKYEEMARSLVLVCRHSIPRNVLEALEAMLQREYGEDEHGLFPGRPELAWDFWETVHSKVGVSPNILSANQSPEVADVAIAAVAALVAAKAGAPSAAEEYYEAAKSAIEKLLAMFSRLLVDSSLS